MSEELMTVAEASKKLSVSLRTVQRYCKQGLLNHKWIHGKRHKELRIVPPIPLSLLPGVKRGSAPGAGDLVTRKEYDELMTSFSRELAERDDRIHQLEQDMSRLAALLAGGGGMESLSPDSTYPGLKRRVESILDDYEAVRPVEKKLILKLACELRAHSEFLHTLGLPESAEM
jgi:hypothetical protein